MPVMERAEIALPPELMNLPTVEYPEEYLAELDVRSQIVRQQLATGEAVPLTADELLAKLGINLGQK